MVLGGEKNPSSLKKETIRRTKGRRPGKKERGKQNHVRKEEERVLSRKGQLVAGQSIGAPERILKP